ncbi:MAG: hypothetical protein K0R81_2678 [Microbacterium sp.]|nr:hypothetical protein [Microbacterium sp.]
MAILVAFLASAVAVLSLLLASPASAQTTTAPTPAASAGTGDVSTQYTIGGIIRAGDDPVEGVEIAVEGSGFSEVGTTGADGRWSVSVPGPGSYTAELKVDTLPDGVVPRDPDNVTRDVTIGTTNTVNVLFPTGEGTTASGSIWDTLFSRFFYGLNFGLLLALAAIGISLIFGTTGVNNFAHGEMLTFGAIIFYVFTAMGWNLLLAVVRPALSVPLLLRWRHPEHHDRHHRQRHHRPRHRHLDLDHQHGCQHRDARRGGVLPHTHANRQGHARRERQRVARRRLGDQRRPRDPHRVGDGRRPDGLGSAFGALVGSLIIGIITELSTIVIPPDLRYAVALIVLIGVLLFRPQGVLGRKERIG